MRCAWSLWVLALLCPCAALADETYEDALVQRALANLELEVEAHPENKRIGERKVFVEDVVGPADPYPDFITRFRFRTHPDVVLREVLLESETGWTQTLADETERNLRRLFLFSVVRVVPVKAATDDTVDVLVVVKDLWSLRFNSDYSLIGTLLQYVRVRPSERNLLGRGKELSLELILRLDTLQLGQGFSDPRFLGSRLALQESVALVFNRETRALEGSTGTVVLSLPLATLTQEEGFSVGGSWNVRRLRRFRGATLLEVVPEGTETAVPYVYDAREAVAEALYTRSYGSAYKLNLSGGLGASTRQYAPPGGGPISDEVQTLFIRQFLPISENATYLLGTLNFFEPRYQVMRNLDTFALSEDVRLGPSATVRVRIAEPTLPETQRFQDLEVTGRYTALLGDNLLRLRSTGTIRFRPAASPVDRRLAVELKNAFPAFVLGRFHHRALIDLNVDDLRTRLQLLGGGNGLRGVAPEALSGRSILLFNSELRTPPVAFHTLHLGGVLFWDAGSAFTDTPHVVHTIGLGLRLLFPQFDVEPLRIDFGYVLNAPAPPVLGRFSSSFGQITETQGGILK